MAERCPECGEPEACCVCTVTPGTTERIKIRKTTPSGRPIHSLEEMQAMDCPYPAEGEEMAGEMTRERFLNFVGRYFMRFPKRQPVGKTVPGMEPIGAVLDSYVATCEAKARWSALQQAHASLQALRYEKGSLSAVQIETAFRKLLAESRERM